MQPFLRERDRSSFHLNVRICVTAQSAYQLVATHLTPAHTHTHITHKHFITYPRRLFSFAFTSHLFSAGTAFFCFAKHRLPELQRLHLNHLAAVRELSGDVMYEPMHAPCCVCMCACVCRFSFCQYLVLFHVRSTARRRTAAERH